MHTQETISESSWREQLLQTMVEGRRDAASELVGHALAEGVSPGHLLTDVLDPALLELGRRWEEGSGSLSETFVGAKIAEDILQRCLATEDTLLTPSKGAVVIGNIEDDFHSLGRRIVGLFLRAASWDVHDLGNDVLAEDFVNEALIADACVVGASAMTLTTAMNIRKLRNLIDDRGLHERIKLAVGGAVFNWRPELVAEVGGDGTAHNAAGADAVLSQLQAEVLVGSVR